MIRLPQNVLTLGKLILTTVMYNLYVLYIYIHFCFHNSEEVVIYFKESKLATGLFMEYIDGELSVYTCIEVTLCRLKSVV